MGKLQYKNALRSKKMIKEAFLQLVCNKDISNIRIKEVIELADISKGTFYAHYQDIYAVLEDIENENIQRFIEYLSENPCESLIEDFSPFINKVFTYIEDNKEFYNKLFNSHVAFTFLNKLQRVFVDFMMMDKKMLSKLKNEEEAKRFFSFIAVGTASLIHEHFLNFEPIPLQELINTLNNCILHGIDAIKISSTGII